MANKVLTFNSFSFKTDANLTNYEENQEVRLSLRRVPRRHGGVTQTQPNLAEKIIGPLSFWVIGTSYDTLRTKLDTAKSALLPGLVGNLKVDDERQLKAQCQSFGHDYGRNLEHALCWVTFLAKDPFWQSVTLNTDTDSGGTPWSPTITNAGNAPSFLKFTATAGAGGLTEFTATNNTNTKTFGWTGALTNGQTLVVDMENMTIHENGVETYTGFDRNTTFPWTLAAGPNALTFDTPSGEDGTVVDLEWRDRWY